MHPSLNAQRRFPLLVPLLSGLALLGCTQREVLERSVPELKPVAAAPSPSVATATEGRVPPPVSKEPTSPKELLRAWTEALNGSDFARLEKLYADKVVFYGKTLARAEVVEKKRMALAKTASFHQEIIGKPKVEFQGDGMRIGFWKRSGPKEAPRDTFATLVVRGSKALTIAEETDLATEKVRAEARLPEGDPKDCDEAIWRLVESTAEAKQISNQIYENLRGVPEEAGQHPGGLGPFLPEETSDDTYEVALGVHSPERFESYGWFSVGKDGVVTVSNMLLNLWEARAVTAPSALGHFKRLCPSKSK